MYDFSYLKATSQLQSGGRVTRNADFYVDLTVPGLGVTEFTTSFFTMDLNFDISVGSNGLPLELEGKPDWLPNLGFQNKANWWDDHYCVNLAKNQYIFIGFKNATNCIQFIELYVNNVPVADTMINDYQICNYTPNVVRGLSQRQNKRGLFTTW
jgi:hypothetical protein